MDVQLIRTVAPWMVGVALGILGWAAGRNVQLLASTRVETQNSTSASARNLPAPEELRDRDERHAGSGSADWQDVLRALLKEPSAATRSERLYALVQQMESRDFPALLEALAAEKDSYYIRGELFEIWAERDLKSARVWYEAQAADERSRFARNLVSVWGRLDARGLGSWIGTLSDEDRKRPAPPFDPTWRELISAIATRDPEAALDLLAKIPEVEPYANDSAVRALVRRDPAAAVAHVMAMPTGEAKNQAFNSLLFSWMQTDAAAALAWVEELDDPEKVVWARSIAAMESARGTEAQFLKALEGLPTDPPEARFYALESRARVLAKSSPEEALVLARSQSDPASREALMVGILREVGSTDPARAMEFWLQEVAKRDGTGEAISRRVHLEGAEELITKLLAKQGVPAALSFLERVPHDQLGMFKNVPSSLAQVAGWTAVADAAIQMPPGTRRLEWLHESVSALTRDGELSAAQRLIARLPAGADRDAASRAMGGALFLENPDAGARTLVALPDGLTALSAELQRWMKADAPEARRWIAKTKLLDETAKQQLLAPAGGAQ